MKPAQVSNWVKVFCCVSPLCTFMLLAIAASLGREISPSVVIGIVYLCKTNTDRFFVKSK